MADMNTVLEGTLKFREGKKWKQRWCIIRKLSPVADRLHIYLYKDENHTVQEKCMFPLEDFYGIETSFTLDKEQHVMAILCQSQVALLAFSSRDVLIQWQIKIRDNLGEERQFPVKLLKAPQQSTIPQGPVKIYIRGQRFCLTANVPPKVLQSWHVHDLRKFGVVDNKFAFEAGSRSGKGAGVHVLMTEDGQEITDALKQAASNKPGRTRKSSMKRRSHMSQQSLSSNKSNISTTESFQRMFDVPDIYSDLSLKSQTLNSRCSSVDSGSDDVNNSDRKKLINATANAQPVSLQKTDFVQNNVKDVKLNTLPKRHSQGELNIFINATVAAEALEKQADCVNSTVLHQANKHKCSSLEILSTVQKTVNCFNHCKLPKCSKKDFFANGLSFRRTHQGSVCNRNGSVGDILEKGSSGNWDLVDEILKVWNLRDLKCLGSEVSQLQESQTRPVPVEVAGSSDIDQSAAGENKSTADDSQVSGKHADYINQRVSDAVTSSKNVESKPRRCASFRRSFTEPNFSKSAYTHNQLEDASLPINAPLPGLDFSIYDGDKNDEYGHKPIVKYTTVCSDKELPNYTNWPYISKEGSRSDCENSQDRCEKGTEDKPSHTYMNLPCVRKGKEENSESKIASLACPEGYHDMKGAGIQELMPDQVSSSTTPLIGNDSFVSKTQNLHHEYENLPGIQSGNNSSEAAPSGVNRSRDYENLPCRDKSGSTRIETVNTKIPINGDLFGLPATYKCYKTSKSTTKTSSVDLSTKVPLERESTYMITSLPASTKKPTAIKESDYMLMQPSKQKMASSLVSSRPLSDIQDEEEIFCAVDLPIRRAESCKSYQTGCRKLQRDGNYLLMSGNQNNEPSYIQMNLSQTSTQNNARVPINGLPMRSLSVRENSSSRPKFCQSRSLDCELDDGFPEDQHSGSDQIKIVKPFDNLIQHRHYSSVKVSLPPEIPPREASKEGVPSRHNSLKTSQELEKNGKNRRFPWFQRRNSSRENSTSSSSSKSNSKSQEDILSCSDGAKELSNSAPSEQTFMRPRSGSADLLGIPVDVSRERSASVPNKSWLGPLPDGKSGKAHYCVSDCYSTLPLRGSRASYREEALRIDESTRSRSSSDASNGSADLLPPPPPPPQPPPLPPRNPSLSSKNKLNSSSRSITPPSASSVLASSTPNNHSQVMDNSTSQRESPASLHISETLNLSGGSADSSSSTASTGIDTSDMSTSASHSFGCRSLNSDSSQSSKHHLPRRHNSVRTHQPAPVVSSYTRHGSLERTSKASRMSVMSGISSLRRGCSSKKKPPALVVEIPPQSVGEDGLGVSRDDSGCLWVERTTPKSATPTCYSRHSDESRVRSSDALEGKSISDTSDLVDNISWSSVGSSETTKSEDSQKVSPAHTTLRPRSGKEYQKLDRKKLVELSPGVTSVASVFTFDKISNYMNVNFPRDGKYTSDSTPPDSPYSPCSTDPDSPLLNYAEIDVDHMEKAKKRPRRFQPKPSNIEYATIDMVATTTASRVGKEHAQLREDILKRKEQSREAMLAQNKEGSLKRKDRKSQS